jgi:hypothetical protein
MSNRRFHVGTPRHVKASVLKKDKAMSKSEELVVQINVGNDSMLEGYHLAAALRKIAKQLDECSTEKQSHKIMDENGNSVGTWELR